MDRANRQLFARGAISLWAPLIIGVLVFIVASSVLEATGSSESRSTGISFWVMVFVLALSRFASALLPVVPTPRQEVGLLWEVEEVRDLIEFVGRIVVELERADRSSDDRYPLGRLRAIEQELKEVEVWCKPELQRGRRRAELDRCLLKVIRLESALMAQLLTRGDPRTTAE